MGKEPLSLKLHQCLQHADTQLFLLQQHIPRSRVLVLRKAVSFSVSSWGECMPNQAAISPDSTTAQPHPASLISWGKQQLRAAGLG